MNVRRNVLIPLLLLLSLDAQAAVSPEETGYFARHIRDALALNRERMPLYDRLTHGASRVISNSQIFYETVALLPARVYDRKARPYQQQGLPILCRDFVSMGETPKFREFVEADSFSLYRKPDVSGWKHEMKDAYRRSGFEGVADVAESKLAQLSGTKTYHCMLRHILESVRRSALLAPVYAREAEVLSLESTDDLEWGFIKLQLHLLRPAVELDHKAAPIQAAGIPILCQDVPETPIP